MSSCRGMRTVACVLLAVVLAAEATAAEPHRWTHDGRLKRDPRFLRATGDVVYAVQESPILMRLMRLNPSTGARTPLAPQAATSQFEASFSPDERYEAVVEFRGVTNVKLLIRDLREGRDALFDPGSDRAHLGNPCIDPRGGRVVFSLPKTAGQQLVSVDMQGQNLRQLTPNSEAIDDWAAFSPDGSQVAFGSSRDGDFDIYVMQSDGTQTRRLTESPGIDMRPAWSPDGRWIAFTSMRDGNYEIYAVRSDGSRLRRLTNDPGRDDFAQWHPDGRRLLTISEREGATDLYVFDVAGE